MDLMGGWPPDFRGWIPGFPGFGVVLARAPDAVLTLTCPAAYPDALRLDLTLLLASPPGETFAARFDPGAPDFLTVSMAWTDGQVTTWGTSWARVGSARSGPVQVDTLSSDGGSDGIRWDLVVYPLPPTETAVVTVAGADFDQVYTGPLDLHDVIAAANRAERWAR